MVCPVFWKLAQRPRTGLAQVLSKALLQVKKFLLQLYDHSRTWLRDATVPRAWPPTSERALHAAALQIIHFSTLGCMQAGEIKLALSPGKVRFNACSRLARRYPGGGQTEPSSLVPCLAVLMIAPVAAPHAQAFNQACHPPVQTWRDMPPTFPSHRALPFLQREPGSSRPCWFNPWASARVRDNREPSSRDHGTCIKGVFRSTAA